MGTFLFAERGTWEDKTLTLKDYRYYQVDFAQVPGLETAPDLLAQVRRVFRVVSQGKTLEVTSDLSRARAIADYADTFSFGQDSLSEAWRKLKDPFLPPLEKWRARLELHSKLALPLANLVLVLLAAAMALRYGKSPGLALGMSVVLALAYYGAFFLGRALAGIGALPRAWGLGGQPPLPPFGPQGPPLGLGHAPGGASPGPRGLPGPWGSGTVAAELADRLARMGHRVYLFATSRPFRLPEASPAVHVPVDLPYYPVFPGPLYTLSLAGTLEREAKRLGLDLVHTHYAVPHAAAAYLAFGEGLPLVHTLHGTDVSVVGMDPAFHGPTRRALGPPGRSRR